MMYWIFGIYGSVHAVIGWGFTSSCEAIKNVKNLNGGDMYAVYDEWGEIWYAREL